MGRWAAGRAQEGLESVRGACILAHSPALRALCPTCCGSRRAATFPLATAALKAVSMGPDSRLMVSTASQTSCRSPMWPMVGVGEVTARQGEEHGVIGQEDQPPHLPAPGPSLASAGLCAQGHPGAPSTCRAPCLWTEVVRSPSQAFPEARKSMALESYSGLLGLPHPSAATA